MSLLEIALVTVVVYLGALLAISKTNFNEIKDSLINVSEERDKLKEISNTRGKRIGIMVAEQKELKQAYADLEYDLDLLEE